MRLFRFNMRPNYGKYSQSAQAPEHLTPFFVAKSDVRLSRPTRKYVNAVAKTTRLYKKQHYALQ